MAQNQIVEDQVLKIHPLLKELKKGLLPFREKICSVFVYGSYSRGEEKHDSDLDILVILNDLDWEKNLRELAYQIMWKFDFSPLLSLSIMSKDHFYKIQTIKTSFGTVQKR